jgi:hypothetical protein
MLEPLIDRVADNAKNRESLSSQFRKYADCASGARKFGRAPEKANAGGGARAKKARRQVLDERLISRLGAAVRETPQHGATVSGEARVCSRRRGRESDPPSSRLVGRSVGRSVGPYLRGDEGTSARGAGCRCFLSRRPSFPGARARPGFLGKTPGHDSSEPRQKVSYVAAARG